MIIYTVNKGDTLYSIAKNYGVTVAELERFNELPDPESLAIGQDVLVPVEGFVYTVKSGDSLYSIASHFGIPLQSLLDANENLTPPYVIMPGDIINIPESATKRTISVNGYAYPDINGTALRKVLPYLTYLSVFSHSITPEGTLIGINDSNLIATTRQMSVAPIMVVTNTERGGGFSSELASGILNSQSLSETLASNIVNTATAKGYYGVDIDFEYIFPADRQKYNAFLSLLRQKTSAAGLTLSTAVAPKISATQKGTLYEGHDYAFHNSVVDYIIIMTYEWGYLYGPPMAVAPYNEVKRVISYAVTEIDSKKILMGMPNYAYDWTLPYREGRPAEILSINKSISRAAQKGAVIEFNETSKAPFYRYTQGGNEHIVWTENARSTAARLQLVSDYNLGGVSYWTVNQFYAQNWRVLESLYNIRKVL